MICPHALTQSTRTKRHRGQKPSCGRLTTQGGLAKPTLLFVFRGGEKGQKRHAREAAITKAKMRGPGDASQPQLRP